MLRGPRWVEEESRFDDGVRLASRGAFGGMGAGFAGFAAAGLPRVAGLLGAWSLLGVTSLKSEAERFRCGAGTR